MKTAFAHKKTVKDLLKGVSIRFATKTYKLSYGHITFQRLPTDKGEDLMVIVIKTTFRNKVLHLPMKTFFKMFPRDNDSVWDVYYKLTA